MEKCSRGMARRGCKCLRPSSKSGSILASCAASWHYCRRASFNSRRKTAMTGVAMTTVMVDNQQEADDRRAFGAFLADLRLHAGSKKIKQTRILAHLPGWTHSSYSRLEDGITSPRYEDLSMLYAAFLQAGVPF